jgi:hypothetical protein
MSFDSFMGSPTDAFSDEPMIPLPIDDTPAPANLGNTEMGELPKDESAMNLVNSPSIKQTFGLSGLPNIPSTNKRLGDIAWNTGETWAILIGGIAIGFIGRALFDRVTR